MAGIEFRFSKYIFLMCFLRLTIPTFGAFAASPNWQQFVLSLSRRAQGAHAILFFDYRDKSKKKTESERPIDFRGHPLDPRRQKRGLLAPKIKK